MVKMYPHLDIQTHRYLKTSHVELIHQDHHLIFYP